MLSEPSPTSPWHGVHTLMQQGLTSTFPSGVLLVQHRGEVLFSQAYGWVDPETRSIATHRSTLFDLASLTKVFTASAFMTLVARGSVTLETPIAAVFPEMRGRHPLLPPIDPHSKKPLPPIPAYVGREVDTREVTFRHLLTHTSGLAAWVDCCRPPSPPPVPLPHQVPQDLRARRLGKVVHSPRFAFPPGETVHYSDVGFILLGEAVERLSRKPLPEYLREAVLHPLGMQSVTYNPLAHDVPREQIAPTENCPWRGRRLWGEVHDENAACLGGVAGHAGLFATAKDLARLGQSFLEHSRGFLPADLAAEMVREHAYAGAERRGLGWKLQTAAESPVGSALNLQSFGHTGFTGTSLWVDPSRQLVVALLTNRVYFGRNGEPIARFRVRLHDTVATTIDALSEGKP